MELQIERSPKNEGELYIEMLKLFEAENCSKLKLGYDWIAQNGKLCKRNLQKIEWT